MGHKSNHCCPFKKRLRDTVTLRENTMGDGGRDWSDAPAGQGTPRTGATNSSWEMYGRIP